MQLPKIIAAVLYCFIFSMPVFAQQKDTLVEKGASNMVKLNLSALVFKNISVQYERKVAKNISVAANVHYIFFAKLPFLSSIEKIIDDPSVPVDKLKIGGFGVTPEIRFYVGKKGALQGFYIAPFVNYTKYKTDLPLNYNSGPQTKTGIFTGDISTITGGLLFGAQWQLGKSFYLDWWIFGPNYGASKGDLNFNALLSANEQIAVKNQIEDLKTNAPFDKIIDSYSVTGNGAFIKAKGPWAGLRGLGINLGYRF